MKIKKTLYCPDQEDFFEPYQHNVEYLNAIIDSGHIEEFILLCEALQEKRLSCIAEDIAKHKDVQLILLAGPSSSGKTSTSKRLAIQLMTCRKWPVALSMDNWFKNRADSPIGEDGKHDFESLHAVDLQLFNRDLQALINGEEVRLPTYNFQTGMREYNGEYLKLRPGTILIVEGIHALNPLLTQEIAEKNKYRVYASPQISISGISPTDNRLLRRITRDYQTRGCSAARTLELWSAVRKGEEKWIVPFKHLANATFNTAMLYELSAIRTKVEAILAEVPADDPEIETVHRLLEALTHFRPITDEQIPKNSLLREFIGGSVFNVG